jgi:hypothetical protein
MYSDCTTDGVYLKFDIGNSYLIKKSDILN